MNDYASDMTEPRKGGLLRWLIVIVIAFVAGSIAMGWVLTHWDKATAYLARQPAPQAPVTPPPAPRLLATPQDGAQIDARVADLEARIGQIDVRAQAAVGNADRAEGLLVAFAARRALDRGIPLGYIEALLRARFGDGQPQAVATIISAARQPTTLDMLQSGLAEVAPALAGPAPASSWWTAMRREVGSLIVVRHAGALPTEPAQRVQRAMMLTEAGHVDEALAEVARLPAHDKANGWIAAARRYAAARSALDVIETAALLAPRDPVPPPAVPTVVSPKETPAPAKPAAKAESSKAGKA
ncbi:hypothetical protein [Flavisphingomonas formosensis]|uniref:hypothetical protein n=1 Tax=Flavisphingomonas formosensis TaxID=861534 RepID=UPI0018DEF238|nr:hypothetical protein [Sphingomonas formosensis]